MPEETYRSVLEYKINQMPRKAHSGSMSMHDYNGGVIGSSRGYFSINGKLMAVPHKTSSRSASTGSLLLSQPMASPRGGTTYAIALDVRRAATARDSLIGELYRNVFEALVARVNSVVGATRTEGGAAAAAVAAICALNASMSARCFASASVAWG